MHLQIDQIVFTAEISWCLRQYFHTEKVYSFPKAVRKYVMKGDTPIYSSKYLVTCQNVGLKFI